MTVSAASQHIVLIAGEASGDMHAATLVHTLRQQCPDLQFSGIGGSHMQQAGVTLLSDLARFGITGFSGVLRHANRIRQAFKFIKAHLITTKPDLLVLIDYPGFNLRLATFAKRHLGLRILYYISPQIWAWKAHRIHQIKAAVDHMAVILPFEKNLYQRAGVPVSFVGHPLMQTCLTPRDPKRLRAHFNLPQHSAVLALLPGSRLHEIDYHLPVFCKALQQVNTTLPHLHVIIPIAHAPHRARMEAYLVNCPVPYTLVHGQALDVIACSDVVIVASGTASLECALLKKPMCIVYKGAWLSYAAAMHFIKVRYFGLCNLLLGGMIVPELLQYDCNPHELAQMIRHLFTPEQTARFLKRLTPLTHHLSMEQADCTLDQLILRLLSTS